MKVLIVAPIAGALALVTAPSGGKAVSSLPQVDSGSAIHLVQRGGGRGGGGCGGGFGGGGGGLGGGGRGIGGGGCGGGGPSFGGGGPRFGGGGPSFGGGRGGGGFPGRPGLRGGFPGGGGGPSMGRSPGFQSGPIGRGPGAGRSFERGPGRGFGGAPIQREFRGRAERGPSPRVGRREFRRGDRRFARRGHWRPGYFWGGVWIGPGLYYANCEWLRRRAYLTGSRYWWRRYNECVAINYS